MAVLRKLKKANYTVIDNGIFKDTELSLKAKGLLCMMLSVRDDWSFSIVGLSRCCKDGKDSVASTLKELEEAGYFRRIQVKEGGKFKAVEYVVSEVKMADSPYTENPNTEIPISENPPQLNTDNNKRLNKSTTKRINRNLHTDATLRPSMENIEAYIKEKDLCVDAKRFYDYFEASEWVDSKGNPVRNWKQKLITWSSNGTNNGAMPRSNSNASRGVGDNRTENETSSEDGYEWFYVPGMETSEREEG